MKRSLCVLAVMLAGCSSQPTGVAEDNVPLQDVVDVPADDGGTGPDEAWDSRVPEDGDAASADDPSTGDPNANDPSTNDPSVEAPSTEDIAVGDAVAETADLVEAEVPALDAVPDADIDSCTPECGEAECGDDGCGGMCGECTGGKVCADGTCECMERAYRACCDNAVCWFDSCGAEGLWIVDCPKGCEASRCVDCTSQCAGKACGEDGCGGECGQCASGECAGLDWTQPGACVNGQCMGGGTLQSCDDGVVCTRDRCDPRSGCRHDVRADGYVCEAGRCEALTWWRPRTCASGACTGGGGTESCLDENLCTDDACSAKAGCVFTPNTTACDDGDPCTVTDSCESGACVGSGVKTCDDGDACTRDDHCVSDGGEQCQGTAYSCDDGLSCTTDTCDGVGGCVNALDAGYCRIDSTCWGDGQPNTDNPCLGCVATTSTTSWSRAQDGSACGPGRCDGMVFTAGKSCLSGACTGGGGTANCDDGNACTTDSCTASGCTNTVQAGYCLIAGSGCVASGQKHPGDPCQVCTPGTSTTAWSAVGEGGSCGTGQVCHLGDCCTRQCGGRTCGDDGCGGSCGTCTGGQDCDAGACVNPTCGGGTCATYAGYNVSCNAQAHCEYANPDATGWKQHDVWIWIPSGSFTMGSPAAEAGHQETEEPAHTVTFARGFLVAKYETTVAQHEACEAAGACSAPSASLHSDGAGWGLNRSSNGRSLHPQNGLTRSQAEAFCGWAGGRMPSEAEWEYAASGPIHRKYPWGDGPEPGCASGTAVVATTEEVRPWGCDSCTTTGCSGTKPVGSMPAGAAWSGALDMGGNVWEQLEDWSHDSYEGAPSDGSAWVDPPDPFQRIRGGSFDREPGWTRTSRRGRGDGAYKSADQGVRCVRDLPIACGGVTCPTMGGYKVTCNAQAHCEYANPDTTGWKKHDVWIYVAPGSFTMGSPSSEAGHQANEKPEHTVTFADGYLVAKYEVTVVQHEACEAAGACTAPATSTWDGDGWGTNRSSNDRAEHPQNGLSWFRAGTVCAWLGGRRPSEAEWEYAVKGPLHRMYAWGNTPDPDCARATFDTDGSRSRPWGCEECSAAGCSGTKPAGSASDGAAWTGAVDTAGNVWEWVEDTWHADYAGAPSDGSAWMASAGTKSVLRGGSFRDGASVLRSTRRVDAAQAGDYAYEGVRCVRDLPITCGGIECPVVGGYKATCNAQAHCEYANPDTTGWKQYDVWVHVPAGSFTMGSPAAEAGHQATEDPNHVVTFAKSYLIEKYEVTVAQYEACKSASPGTCTAPSTADNEGFGWGPNTSANGRSSHPQNGLTWDQAGAVCTWMGGRRPSEAEWEYAAAGPTHRKYPWGDTPEPACSHAVFDPDGTAGLPWSCDSCTANGCSGTKAVGSVVTGASWCGAFDMAGNAWEWVEDWYHSTYGGAPTDGSAWVSPASEHRMMRGGSFDNAPLILRSSHRRVAPPAHRSATGGVRCVKPL